MWFGKRYTTQHAEAARAAIFADNVAVISAHNAEAGEQAWRMGVNQFSDLTTDEYVSSFEVARKQYAAEVARTLNRFNRSGARPQRGGGLPSLPAAAGVPPVDWRSSGAVTPVKNQGQCAGCWAFAAVGATEGAYQIATGALRSLSEQELIDCAGSAFGNLGCQGGIMTNAYNYIMQNNGIDSEDDYVYAAATDQCWTAATKRNVAAIETWQAVKPNNESQLEAAVAKGPVSVAIEADQAGFQHYASGVYDGACGTKLDHGVLVVGFTADYWIVKNSWGTAWGVCRSLCCMRFRVPLSTCSAALCRALSFVFPAAIVCACPK